MAKQRLFPQLFKDRQVECFFFLGGGGGVDNNRQF